MAGIIQMCTYLIRMVIGPPWRWKLANYPVQRCSWHEAHAGGSLYLQRLHSAVPDHIGSNAGLALHHDVIVNRYTPSP